ncbi:hypothetical protein HN031_13075 [Nocardioides sp. zg-1308]|uniref:hypothetical protein n=1 Tax=Nocardioides sp. zg-1308 TaxID=2736253 RepID=UPI0015534D64|nr:hypothetical protein [Nocardioides sp. zg-1308]NPD05619.1 hypothetical protein [Nocardioides sp. zg-1308]
MHHDLSAALAGSRERELRTVVRRPDHLMAHALELDGDVPPSRRVRRTRPSTRSRRRSS